MAENGWFIQSASGFVRTHPALSVLKEARTDLARALRELGMSPSSRSRVGAIVPEPENDDDPFAAQRGAVKATAAVAARSAC